jgi:membrane-bound serine protease (ClpP class)
MKKIVNPIIFICFAILLFGSSSLVDGAGEGKVVFIIPVEQEVERGLEAFLQRSLNVAHEKGADHIILKIDTPGGRVDAAGNIAKIMQETKIPITAFIVNKALSAGAYIALNADTIVMKPGATIGAAGVIDQAGNAADKKAQSAWIAAMVSAAQLNDRDVIYAKAMADPNINLPKYDAPKGEFLTLTSTKALEVGYAEKVIDDDTELLYYLNMDNAKVETMEVSFAEKIARFVTSPVIIPILLSIGSLGLIVELYSPGFGIPGLMGLSSLGLFFYGHLVAGFAGWESMIFLVGGIILILLELFLPGGILGILGLISIIASFFFASYDLTHMAISLTIALVLTVIAAIALYKFIGYRGGLLSKIILKDATSAEKGYNSFDNRHSLIGLEGESLTDLRPSGTAIINDERMDVVSEGTFIPKGSAIKVIKIEGIRVIVRELNK